jgi:hypothetical protein
MHEYKREKEGSAKCDLIPFTSSAARGKCFARAMPPLSSDDQEISFPVLMIRIPSSQSVRTEALFGLFSFPVPTSQECKQ